jgi:hypothetical protein
MINYRPATQPQSPFNSPLYRVVSGTGLVRMMYANDPRAMNKPPPIGWSLEGYSVNPDYAKQQKVFRGFGWSSHLVDVPHWALVLLAAVVGTFPWFHAWHWRFSLRSLLIATLLASAAYLHLW